MAYRYEIVKEIATAHIFLSHEIIHAMAAKPGGMKKRSADEEEPAVSHHK